MDKCIINSWILFHLVNNSSISHHKFIISLIDQLHAPHLSHKTSQPVALINFATLEKHVLDKHVTCKIGQCNENKTHDICTKCHKPVCGTCKGEMYVLCKPCFQKL